MKVWKKIFSIRYKDITIRTTFDMDFPTNAHLFYAWNTKTSITTKGRWEISIVNKNSLLVVDKLSERKFKVLLTRHRSNLGVVSWNVFAREVI